MNTASDFNLPRYQLQCDGKGKPVSPWVSGRRLAIAATVITPAATAALSASCAART